MFFLLYLVTNAVTRALHLVTDKVLKTLINLLYGRAFRARFLQKGEYLSRRVDEPVEYPKPEVFVPRCPGFGQRLIPISVRQNTQLQTVRMLHLLGNLQWKNLHAKASRIRPLVEGPAKMSICCVFWGVGKACCLPLYSTSSSSETQRDGRAVVARHEESRSGRGGLCLVSRSGGKGKPFGVSAAQASIVLHYGGAFLCQIARQFIGYWCLMVGVGEQPLDLIPIQFTRLSHP